MINANSHVGRTTNAISPLVLTTCRNLYKQAAIRPMSSTATTGFSVWISAREAVDDAPGNLQPSAPEIIVLPGASVPTLVLPIALETMLLNASL